MIGILVSGVLSALLLWVMQFLPFLNIYVTNIFSISFLIVAVAIGVINAVLVPLVKNVLKPKTPLILLIVTLLVDAAGLMLADFLVSGFGIGFVSAIIAGAVLAALNFGAGSISK